MHPFYTIGHSTRSIAEFLELLRSVQVTLVVDVRTVPRSRTNPQYNGDSLPDTLSSSNWAMNTSPRLVVFGAPPPTFPPMSMHSGKTRASTITRTTPWAIRSTKD